MSNSWVVDSKRVLSSRTVNHTAAYAEPRIICNSFVRFCGKFGAAASLLFDCRRPSTLRRRPSNGAKPVLLNELDSYTLVEDTYRNWANSTSHCMGKSAQATPLAPANRRPTNLHSKGWGLTLMLFRMLKYKNVFFQIKYTEAILSNNTWKLLWFEIIKMLIVVLKINLLCYYNFRHTFVPYYPR